VEQLKIKCKRWALTSSGYEIWRETDEEIIE